ncbi:MAG: hypothetical protein H6618_03525 [Deltaproteobacteria bacterium]|nr:hypothetical protein [Deltaproteobacteria bacterium]
MPSTLCFIISAILLLPQISCKAFTRREAPLQNIPPDQKTKSNTPPDSEELPEPRIMARAVGGSSGFGLASMNLVVDLENAHHWEYYICQRNAPENCNPAPANPMKVSALHKIDSYPLVPEGDVSVFLRACHGPRLAFATCSEWTEIPATMPKNEPSQLAKTYIELSQAVDDVGLMCHNLFDAIDKYRTAIPSASQSVSAEFHQIIENIHRRGEAYCLGIFQSQITIEEENRSLELTESTTEAPQTSETKAQQMSPEEAEKQYREEIEKYLNAKKKMHDAGLAVLAGGVGLGILSGSVLVFKAPSGRRGQVALASALTFGKWLLAPAFLVSALAILGESESKGSLSGEFIRAWVGGDVINSAFTMASIDTGYSKSATKDNNISKPLRRGAHIGLAVGALAVLAGTITLMLKPGNDPRNLKLTTSQSATERLLTAVIEFDRASEEVLSRQELLFGRLMQQMETSSRLNPPIRENR